MALEGKNPQAVAEFYKWIDKVEPPTPNENVGVLVAPAELSQEEYVAKMMQISASVQEYDFDSPIQDSEYQGEQCK